MVSEWGADPAKTLERTMGLWALRVLVAGLAVTPLRRLGWNLVRYRRALGLLAFYYAALHVVAYAWFDYGLDWAMIWGDIVKRPYITIGLAAFLILVPLAVTSTNGMIRRLGAAAWQRLHKLVYVAAIGGAVHFLMLVKVVTAEPAIYAGLVALLLAARLVPAKRRRRDAAAQKPLATAPQP
jgi:sulfoxide reductase heme-binding subunit YedZ